MPDEMLRFPCPKCGKRLKAPADRVGSKATCQSCGEKMLVPAPAASELRGQEVTANLAPAASGEVVAFADLTAAPSLSRILDDRPDDGKPIRWDLVLAIGACSLFAVVGLVTLIIVLAGGGKENKPAPDPLAAVTFDRDKKAQPGPSSPASSPSPESKPPSPELKVPEPEPKGKFVPELKQDDKFPDFKEIPKKPGEDEKPKTKEIEVKKDPDPKPKIEVVRPKMPENIRQAIDKGVAHLKKRLDGGGKLYRDEYVESQKLVETGAAALAGLAMLEAGVAPDDPGVRKSLEFVRKNAGQVTLIYSLGAMLMFLNRLDAANALTEDDRRLARTLALRVIAGQCNDGRWTYVNSQLKAAQEDRLFKELAAGTYRPGVNRIGPAMATSNSMTQFALLSLWGCRKHVAVRQPILHAAARFQATQHANGSWDYGPNTAGWFFDSNTCAGLLALAMEKTLRSDKELSGVKSANDPPANPRVDEQRDKGFTYLANVIGRPLGSAKDPKGRSSVFGASAWGDYYFLWCLERVSVIYSMDEIGGKDWYMT